LTQEIERISDVIQPGDAFWESLKGEWTTGHAQALEGHLRCARAAANVGPRYGERSLKQFADELGVGSTTAYEYAGAWHRLMERYADEQTLLERLENSPLTIWQVIEATKGPYELLNQVEDENLSVRAIKRLVSGEEEEENAETVELCCCPKCGEVYPMSEAMTWTDTR
jgi:hypothetical protein